MNSRSPDRSPLNWKAGIWLGLGAVVSFHLAYASHENALWPLFMIGYLGGLILLGRLKTPRLSFYFGMGAGLLCIAPQLACFWRIFGLAAIPLWMILAFWTGAFVLLTHLVQRRFQTTGAVLLLPFLWTGLEYFRSELYYLKFSWMNVGYAFAHGHTSPLHLLGGYGIGFLVALAATLFMTFRPAYILGGVMVVILFLVSPFIAHRQSELKPPLRLAGVQLEFPFEREIPVALDRALAKYPDADVMVLSEYSLDGPVPDLLKRWCQSNHKYLIVGGKDPAPNHNFYDTGFVVGPEGQLVFQQVKSVPIQFFKDGLPAPTQAVWNSPWGKIGICICYDLSYTRVTDRLVEKGAQLLVVPTMDVTDWGKRQHELHAMVAPVRSAEYGIPIFRLASSGISQAVDHNGKVVAQADYPGQNEILYAELQPTANGTLPLDRWLAPFSVGVTCLTILRLFCFRKHLQNDRTPTTANRAEPLPSALNA